MPSPCLEDKMKRLLTGIFALILMLGCITISQPRATAADTPKEITAYLTIALQDATESMISLEQTTDEYGIKGNTGFGRRWR